MPVVAGGDAGGGRERAVTKRRPRRHAKNEVDVEDVERASAFIRERLRESDSSLRSIGDYLLDTFFEGDPAIYAVQKRTHAVLRELLRAAGTLDLPLSKTAVSNAMGLAIVTRQLGTGSAFSKLPQSIAVELLPLRDGDAIELLAIDVESSRMTVREVRSVVRDLRPKRETGRRRKPRLLLAVAALERVLGDVATCGLEIGTKDLAELDAPELARARTAIGRVRDGLAKLLTTVEAPSSSDVGTTSLREAVAPTAHDPAEGRLPLAAIVTVL